MHRETNGLPISACSAVKHCITSLPKFLKINAHVAVTGGNSCAWASHRIAALRKLQASLKKVHKKLQTCTYIYMIVQKIFHKSSTIHSPLYCLGTGDLSR